MSFLRRAFVVLVMRRSFGSWSRASLILMGWRVISNAPVGVASRSGLIGVVVNVVCLGCQPSDCFGDMGGDVRVFLRRDAFAFV